MKTTTLAVALLLAVAGCVSVQQIPITDSPAALQGREVSLAMRDKPDFGAMTAGGMMGGALFGAVGGAIAGSAMVSAGNQIVAEYNLTDPAELIAPALGEALGQKFNVRLGKLRPRLSTDDAAEAAKSAAGSDVVLDVRTINWGFLYFPKLVPIGEHKYRVLYSARGRLIDVKQGKVLAEGGCSARSKNEQSADAPTYDELLANSAARLKDELAIVTDACLQQLAEKMFAVQVAGLRHAPAAQNVATVAPSASTQIAAPPVKPGGLPPAGSTWSYSFSDKVYSNRYREFSVRATAVDDSSVTELLSAGSEQQVLAASIRDVVFQKRRVAGEEVFELSPYLLAAVPVPAVPLPQGPRTYPGPGEAKDWSVRVTQVAREEVSVPAGRFDTYRLEITGENSQGLFALNFTGSTTDARTQRFHYEIWYAPQIGRYVQIHHKTFDKTGKEISDEWVRLKTYAPGSTAPSEKKG